MMIADILVILIILIAVVWAISSIVGARKKGKHCIGCPYSGDCSGKDCGGKK